MEFLIMLQTLNERVQGIFAWVIILLITTTFALFGVEYYMQGRQSGLAKAEVNGDVISTHEFDVAYRRSQSANNAADLTPVAEANRKMQFLTALIQRQLSIQSAIADGFWVSPALSADVIRQIPDFQQGGQFSTVRFQQMLSHAMFTPDSFQREVKDSILVNQHRFAITGTEFSLPSEVKRYVSIAMQTRDYEYVVVPAKSFLNKVTVTEPEMRTYYDAHRSEFVTPESLTIDYVRLSMKDIKNDIKPTDAQLKRFFDENKSDYHSPSQWKVERIVFPLPASANPKEQSKLEAKAQEVYKAIEHDPKQFEHYLKETSGDQTVTRNSETLPWIDAGNAEYAKDLLKLTTVGQITAPIRTSRGYEILKLKDYKPAEAKTFNAVRAQVLEQVTNEQAQSTYAKALEQLADLSYQTPDTLEPVAKALHLSVLHSAAFGRSGGSDSLTQHKRVIEAAFSHDVLDQGNNSDSIQLDGDSVIVLRVANHTPAKEKSFAEVKGTIEALLKSQLAQKEAKQFGQRIIELSSKQAQPMSSVDGVRLVWKPVNKANLRQNDALSPMTHIAYRIGTAGELSGGTIADGDFVVVRLKSIIDGDLKTIDKSQLAIISTKLEMELGQIEYQLYMNRLQANAKIVYS